ncbi:MAG: VOC family protein [Spirochaetia bacterium]|jgi:hypothetical protein|nr:VOC family protein [Spirochaetia bacterium]
MIFKRVDHVKIVSSVFEKALDFYVNVLGFKIKSRHPAKMAPMREGMYIELGNTVIEIIVVDNPNPKSEALWGVGYRGIALDATNMVLFLCLEHGAPKCLTSLTKDKKTALPCHAKESGPWSLTRLVFRYPCEPLTA